MAKRRNAVSLGALEIDLSSLLAMRIFTVLSTTVLLCGIAAFGQTKLAATPPMGWNSWNHFAGRVTDADVRSAADMMVSTGMRDAGYVYVNVDDTWQGERDAQGVLHPNKRFPDMKALGDYIHSKGLKFGIYSSPGAKTCGKYAGVWTMRRRTRRCMRTGEWTS
jgi:alpha-galactosidase